MFCSSLLVNIPDVYEFCLIFLLLKLYIACFCFAVVNRGNWLGNLCEPTHVYYARINCLAIVTLPDRRWGVLLAAAKMVTYTEPFYYLVRETWLPVERALPAMYSHLSHRIHEFVLSSHLVLKMSPIASYTLLKLILTLRSSSALINYIALIMLSSSLFIVSLCELLA